MIFFSVPTMIEVGKTEFPSDKLQQIIVETATIMTKLATFANSALE